MGRDHRGLPAGNRLHRSGSRPGYVEAATGRLPADPGRDHGRSTDVANLARRNILRPQGIVALTARQSAWQCTTLAKPGKPRYNL